MRGPITLEFAFLFFSILLPAVIPTRFFSRSFIPALLSGLIIVPVPPSANPAWRCGRRWDRCLLRGKDVSLRLRRPREGTSPGCRLQRPVSVACVVSHTNPSPGPQKSGTRWAQTVEFADENTPNGARRRVLPAVARQPLNLARRRAPADPSCLGPRIGSANAPNHGAKPPA